jgi:large subunit ribosomal protein L7/L12
MAKLGIQEIVDAVADLSVLELSELVKAIEDKFGVTAAAPVAVAAAGAAPAAEAAEEKTEFDVELTAGGDNKIGAIKALREIDQSLGLAEAKAKVESAPVVVASGVKKEDAEAMKKKLEEAGAKVTLK